MAVLRHRIMNLKTACSFLVTNSMTCRFLILLSGENYPNLANICQIFQLKSRKYLMLWKRCSSTATSTIQKSLVTHKLTNLNHMKTAKLCPPLFSCLGVDGITLNDIDIAHHVQIRASAAVNKPKSIICTFTWRLAREKVMAVRRACGNISSEDLGFSSDITFERIGIYDHLTPKLQELLHSANNFKTQHGYKFCGAKNAVVFLRKNESSRPIKVKMMDDLASLMQQSEGTTHQTDE